MNAAMRPSPPPRPCRDAAAFSPLIIPADTPSYARRFLAKLDAAIMHEAGGEACLAPRSIGSPADASPGDLTATPIRASPPSPDSRLIVAGRMHIQASGALAFFLFHYLRLLEGQAQARHAGLPCPAQTWTMPNWRPASPASKT